MTEPDRDDAEIKELVKRHWDWRASTFDAESQHGIHSDEQRERWHSVLRERIGEEPRRVLDVGCGTGVLSLLLAELGHDVSGVDVAPGMLARAREKARRADGSMAFLRGDAEALPVADDAVELVTARHLVWTLADPATALAEWQRVVEPGGRILLVEGHWDHDEPWDEYEAIHDDLPLYDGLPPGALREWLEQVGVRDVRHEPLRDPVLWGREPRHEYYVVVGTVPR